MNSFVLHIFLLKDGNLTLHYVHKSHSLSSLYDTESPFAEDSKRLHESWMTLFKICFSLQKKLDCIKEQTFDSIININPTLLRIFSQTFFIWMMFEFIPNTCAYAKLSIGLANRKDMDE